MIELMPSTEEEEVLQNVRMIAGIWRGSVALDRELGTDAGILDAPTGHVSALLTAELTKTIAEYEPRARLKGLENKMTDGKLEPVLELEVKT